MKRYFKLIIKFVRVCVSGGVSRGKSTGKMSGPREFLSLAMEILRRGVFE
jgi:hypothetical protein